MEILGSFYIKTCRDKQVSCNPNRRHNRHQTNNKTDDKMPTLRKIKRGVLPTHLPTQKHHI
jgi:hypothetical protein